MRTAGSKNKLTIEKERLISTGMTQEEAKVVAKINLGIDTQKSETVVKQKRKSKNEIVMPDIVKGYNTTTRSAWLKSQNGSSRKFAIRAMCLMCVGGSYKEVQSCTASYCPLHKFRITG